MARPRFAGYTRWDDHTRDPVIAEPPVDLLLYSDDPAYLERRRETLLQHAGEQLAIARRRSHADPTVTRSEQLRALDDTRLWERVISQHAVIDWASGEGDRTLF